MADEFCGKDRRQTVRRREDYCYLHSAHEAMMKEHQRRLDEAEDKQKELDRDVDDKVSMKLFIVLCTFIVGGLGFQLAIYDSIKTVESKVAVIESQLKGLDTVRESSKEFKGYVPQEFMLNWGIPPNQHDGGE